MPLALCLLYPNWFAETFDLLIVIHNGCLFSFQDFLSDPEMITILEKFFDDIKTDERTLPVVKEIVGSLEK